MKLVCLALFLTAAIAQAKVIEITPKSVNDYGDPSQPVFKNQKVTITTTGGFLLTWKSEKAFFGGQSPTTELLKVCHADGTPLSLEDGEDIWDPTLEEDGRVLIGSIMTPPPNRKTAHWPEDAFSRRTFTFHKRNGCWRRGPEPMWPPGEGWIGHTYGHDVLENVWFYEKVTQTKNGGPQTTDLFARHDGKETKILKSAQWPSARRENGATLVEGARPFRFGNEYFIAFSAGDYASPNYGIHLLKSRSVTGPYKPILNAKNDDFKDFSYLIEDELPLTWGAGRAVFFEHNQQWWVIAHGIPEPFDGEDGLRRLYLAPVDPAQLK